MNSVSLVIGSSYSLPQPLNSYLNESASGFFTGVSPVYKAFWPSSTWLVCTTSPCTLNVTVYLGSGIDDEELLLLMEPPLEMLEDDGTLLSEETTLCDWELLGSTDEGALLSLVGF